MARTLAVFGVLSFLCAGAALADRTDPLPAFVFQLQAGNLQTFLKDCTQIGSQTEVIEVNQGNGIVAKVPGRTTALNVNCSRGLTNDLSFFQWRHDVETAANGFRRQTTLTVLDTALTPLTTFTLYNTWPSSLIVNSSEDSSGNLVLKENISIVVEGIDRQ